MALLILSLSWLMGCQTPRTEPSPQRFSYAELHMASIFRLVMYAPDESTANQAAEAAFKRVADLAERLSDYNPNSELSRLSAAPLNSPIRVSDDLFKVLHQAQIISEKSGGGFDVTVGPLVQLWRQTRKSGQLPTPGQIAAATRSVGFHKIRLSSRDQTVTLTAPGMKLDVGGIAKGYTADAVLAVLRQRGIHRAMVAASGDIAVGDPPPGKPGWRIGIASIDHPQEGLTRELLLRNQGISTSGDTEQYIEVNGRRFSHIVDPQTGIGLTNRTGVTIIAKNATLSDGLATAVSVIGAKKGTDLVRYWPGTAALIVEISPAGTNYYQSGKFPPATEYKSR